MHLSPRRHITVLIAALALTTPAVAQLQEPVDSGTTAAIHRLLELTGTAQVALRGVEAMVRAQRATNPQIPAAFWDALLARARRQMPQYVDSLIPIYRAHLTRAEQLCDWCAEKMQAQLPPRTEKCPRRWYSMRERRCLLFRYPRPLKNIWWR